VIGIRKHTDTNGIIVSKRLRVFILRVPAFEDFKVSTLASTHPPVNVGANPDEIPVRGNVVSIIGEIKLTCLRNCPLPRRLKPVGISFSLPLQGTNLLWNG